MSRYTTLVISPHADDEVLGCGGVLAERGNSAFVYYLGIDEHHVVSKIERIEEVKKVSEYLGFGFEVGPFKVNHYDRKTLIDPITDLINRLRPDEIFIPHNSYNQDHEEVRAACLIALRPHDRNHFVSRVFEYEVDQYLMWGENDFDPNYFEPIDIEKKIKAYLLHASQVRGMRPPEMLEKMAVIRGYSALVPHAEGFRVLRMVKKSKAVKSGGS